MTWMNCTAGWTEFVLQGRRNREKQMTVAVSVTFSRVPATSLIVLCALVSVAQEKKEVRYQVGLKAVISISNNYGPITIKPSPAGEVLITMVSLSNAVSFKNDQHKNRVHLRSISPVQGENQG